MANSSPEAARKEKQEAEVKSIAEKTRDGTLEESRDIGIEKPADKGKSRDGILQESKERVAKKPD
jgi:hypothetical protein